ncbi:Ribose-5-phosphate isomerase A [compost metagenome]
MTERRSSSKTGLTITDDGHYLMEAKFEKVEDVEQLATELNAIPGLLEHSLFNGIATKALIATKDEIYLIERKYE